MAYVDLKGSTGPAVYGLLDLTHRKLEPVEHELLPRGLAWDREDPVRQSIVAAQCTELSRVDVRADGLLRELDPHFTFALLDDWEVELGLPECAAPTTIEARRAAILAKLLAEGGHGQGKGWWTDFLTGLGYPPEYFLQGQEVMTCNDDCIDVVWDEEWMYVWQISVQTGIDDALLVCFVNHNALLGSLPLVHFMWSSFSVIVDPAPLYGVAVTDVGFAAAVGEDGLNLYAGGEYEEAGGWSTLGYEAATLYAVAAVGDVLVACGIDPCNFLRSVDGGATWSTVANLTGAAMFAITPGTGLGTAVAAGENSTVWRSVDSGTSWSLAAPTDADASDVYGLTRCTGAVVAVSQNGHAYRTTDNGLTWADIGDVAAAAPLHAISAWELLLVAVGDGGVIIRSVDGGLSFEPVTSPTTADLRGVVGTPAGRWTACGLGGVILQSLDDGVTWKVHDSPTTEDLYAVTRHIPTGRALIVGNNVRIIVE